MGDGINVSRGVTLRAPVEDLAPVEESKTKETKAEPQPAQQPADKPSAPSSPSLRLEQTMNATARQAELNSQLVKMAKGPDPMKAAQSIMDNPKLSNDAKIAEMQKTLEKSDPGQFADFMRDYPNLPQAQKELINSAITESPKIMDRVARELPQDQQLTIVRDAMMHPAPATSEKDEAKRMQRTDKAMAEWIRGTDRDTLSKALDGQNINDIKAASKLYGVMASNPASILAMDKQGKLDPEQTEIGMTLVNISRELDLSKPSDRKEIEGAAASMILKNHEREARERQTRLPVRER